MLTPETPLVLPISLLCVLVGSLIAVTWRLANYIKALSDRVGSSWTFRDQERWAINLERENRARGNALYVPEVTRAPDDEAKDKA